MERQRPDLKIIQGGLSEQKAPRSVESSKGFMAEIRRALGRLSSVNRAPEEDPKTGWGKGF